MGKSYSGKQCAYCAEVGASSTGDHVFARQFFPEKLRANLPKVPACEPCNQRKSILEHYLATVLPFGGQHEASVQMLVEQVPRRLARNEKLREQLSDGRGSVLIDDQGVANSRLTIPFETAKLAELFALVARGLTMHQWGVVIPSTHHAGAGFLSRSADAIMRQQFVLRAARRSQGALGNGLILFEGAQAIDDPGLTIWRFQIYGGALFGGDPAAPGETVSDVWAITAAKPVDWLFTESWLGRRN